MIASFVTSKSHFGAPGFKSQSCSRAQFLQQIMVQQEEVHHSLGAPDNFKLLLFLWPNFHHYGHLGNEHCVEDMSVHLSFSFLHLKSINKINFIFFLQLSIMSSRYFYLSIHNHSPYFTFWPLSAGANNMAQWAKSLSEVPASHLGPNLNSSYSIFCSFMNF